MVVIAVDYDREISTSRLWIPETGEYGGERRSNPRMENPRSYIGISWCELAEVEAHVKFFFEEIGTAVGVAQILGGISAGLYLQAHRAALEGGLNTGDTLAVGVIEAFGDAKDGGQAAGHAFVEV